jgi:hypothetical protein
VVMQNFVLKSTLQHICQETSKIVDPKDSSHHFHFKS